MLGKCLTVSKIILAVLAVVFCFLQSAAAGNYRIGYLEGGSYWLFSDSMDAVKESLESREMTTISLHLQETVQEM